MKTKTRNYPNLGMLALRDDRLYLSHNFKGNKVELDVTPVWHFFKEFQQYMENPRPLPRKNHE